jgi:hypothetical protein
MARGGRTVSANTSIERTPESCLHELRELCAEIGAALLSGQTTPEQAGKVLVLAGTYPIVSFTKTERTRDQP